MPTPEAGSGQGRRETGDIGEGKCALAKGHVHCKTETKSSTVL